MTLSAHLLLPALAVVIGYIHAPVSAQDPDLAAYFGFEGLEIIKAGDNAGPIAAADMNGDGLIDLIVVNNHASRIELHLQKAGASPEDAVAAPLRINEFPEHWRFRREPLSVAHEVRAIVAHDFDADGLLDIIYAGLPQEIVFLRQSSPGAFSVARRHRVRDLSANRDGLAIADILDDEHPELLALVNEDIRIWPMYGDVLGAPTTLPAEERIAAMLVADFDGNGRADVAGIIPEDPAPVRLWLAATEDGRGVVGPQLRFEMPPLREATAIRLNQESAARLAVIEIASRRVVLYRLASEAVEQTGDRDAPIRIHSFSDAGNRKRDHAIVDVDGDGLPDLLATDTEANAVVVYWQAAGKGMHAGVPHPSLSEVTYLVAGQVDDDPYAELFVLSEKEGVVGRSDITPDGIPFPQPLSIAAGFTPTALQLVHLEDEPKVAVVAKDSRDYVLELIGMDGGSEKIELGKLSRSPDTIVGLDADQDGRTDLLLLTRDKPMTMLRATEEGFELLESQQMGQYGLVKAAQAENIAVFDIDGDGKQELLITDQNFARAVRYEPEPPAGISPGWQVVKQVNTRDSASKLVSVATLGERIVAADKENDRLVIMARQGTDSEWEEVESLVVRGFDFNEIHAGSFAGDEQPSILAVGHDGFAVISLGGERVALEQVASWRTSDERRYQHELASGDVNSDGFTDMIALDAGEQMAEIFTFTETGKMLYATGFQVYESRLFMAGEPRVFQPSQALVEDVTGDGAADLILLAHDRVLLYPQMTEPE